ncbi:hypothetical protein SKAU_G00401070 [Synaphobranchus kaupii]|uniref:Uncharacterized protein n=1 Tax=Synaphobranchus kaupii TaxID=118154 RepID=A0A9Q1IAD4_SYNKA|nr:hypothetical protein SKAU_G00401070 [Synaphobranchus kaupii]
MTKAAKRIGVPWSWQRAFCAGSLGNNLLFFNKYKAVWSEVFAGDGSPHNWNSSSAIGPETRREGREVGEGNGEAQEAQRVTLAGERPSQRGRPCLAASVRDERAN